MRNCSCSCKPSFLRRARIGIRKVRRCYPHAQLLEIQGFPACGSLIETPQDIDEMVLVFSNMNVQPDGTRKDETLFIHSTGPKTFGQIEVIDRSWDGVDPIKFRRIRMSLARALRLKKRAGFTRPEDGVFVCKTVSLVNEDILYIFGTRSPFHIVNTRTKKVFEQSMDFERPHPWTKR